MTTTAGQQTSVPNAMTIAFEGMLADTSDLKHCDAKYNAEASAEIAFGRGVVRYASDKDNGVVKPNTSAAAAATTFAGVTVHSHDYSPDIELGSTGMKAKVTMNILQRGRIYVLPEDTVTPGDAVRLRVLAGSGTVGKFLTTADSANCINLSKMARWVTSGSSTVPALLEFDMVGAANITADS